jgi:alpha-mannosidase
MTKTVHLILNAHLDPVWLWSWRDGLDEVLNTAYYICGLLDRHPDIIYTRGESWVYEQIREVDPGLYARVLGHVRAGRWSPVGGWFVQPDCNLPSGFAMERQIRLGQEFFSREFGAVPEVAYNVDSFGHSAALPDLIHRHGQRYYVMMRPQEHEMALPARLFRWRGREGGAVIPTFRIARAYNTSDGPSVSGEHIRDALSELPPGVNHTMCFVGIGDHGGGPTEELIAWCREHRDHFEGARLEFSSPEKFFRAVREESAELPLFTGELQQHAIGCYSVHRGVKTAVRRAEHALRQAEITTGKARDARDEAALDLAWRQVCFHHFHDTLGGTCLPSAYREVLDELGLASATADRLATYALRRRATAQGEDAAQRLVFFNASERAFDDFVEIEPWLEWSAWQPRWRLADESGAAVPFQVIQAESAWYLQTRLLFRLAAGPGETRVLRILEGAPDGPPPPAISMEEGIGLLPRPRLVLCDNFTDTWSHGIDRFARENALVAEWEAPNTLESGPLRVAIQQTAVLGASEAVVEWRRYAGLPFLEMVLRIHWQARHQVLRLEWDAPASGEFTRREDGIMEGSLVRALDGRELPLRDWMLLGGRAGGGETFQAAVLAPEVYSASAEPGRIGLTLLRAAPLACHTPNVGDAPRTVFSDQGEHVFRFRFLASPAEISVAGLEEWALGLHRPLLSADLTRGMRKRAYRESYVPWSGSL